MSILDPTTLTCTRRTGAWVSGHWVPGAPSTYTVVASRPQPVGPETLEMLPEEARSSAKFEIYVEDDQTEIHMIDYDSPTTPADLVAYGGHTYVVTGVEDWADVPLGHRAYVLLAFAPDEEVSG
jgi:hypothetical protein